MFNYNENDIKLAAYYIWKNNGCPANSSAHDWNSAINQLSALAAMNNNGKKASLSNATKKSSAAKTSSCKTASSSLKKTAVLKTAAKKATKKSK